MLQMKLKKIFSSDKNESSSSSAAERLIEAGTICTYSASRKIDPRSRDINVQNLTLQHRGNVMLDDTQITLNHGNRYGLLGRNGCGKSTLVRALGARSMPIPDGIDIFHLKEEIEPSDTVTAFDAVMSVDEERSRLEKQAEAMNTYLSTLSDDSNDSNDNKDGNDDDDDNCEPKLSKEEEQEKVMDLLNSTYERLDALDADTAEVRARAILKGLGFTHEMQSKFTSSFSGGWRMRVSLARALFIQPTLLLLDEPTNHLDMEAVIWLEDYLSRWDKILLLISHSQDFLNNVTTHTIHFTNRNKLQYFAGNYDQFIKTKSELEENQIKRYKWEQDQIKSMREYVARFGHGTSKNAKQAQSKEKVLAKMIRAGLTAKPELEKPMNFQFADPGHLPPPVLAFHDVSFAYPKCEPLYAHVDFGVDLDSRVALVGPNGAGKTTLVKLMSSELLPTSGDIRPHGHLKIGRFTQHFVDVLDLKSTPLEFFDKLYPGTPWEDQRKYLGRFGVSGKMQVQNMSDLSDGQKSRVVFAKLGRERPHILLLDEPTNHLDMESIDALAKAVNDFAGGMVLVSHDMRLISQVANEIWICDDKSVSKYKGDIKDFKMDMRTKMGIEKQQTPKLKGDASVVTKKEKVKKNVVMEKSKGKDSSISILQPEDNLPSLLDREVNEVSESFMTTGLELKTDKSPDVAVSNGNSVTDIKPKIRYIPPHSVIKRDKNPDIGASNGNSEPSVTDIKPKARYVPPHLRNKK